MTGFLNSGLWGLCWLVSSGSKARLSTSKVLVVHLKSPGCPHQEALLSTSKAPVVHIKRPCCPPQKPRLSTSKGLVVCARTQFFVHCEIFYIAKFRTLFVDNIFLWTHLVDQVMQSCGQILWTKVCGQSLWTKVCGQKFVDNNLRTRVCGQTALCGQKFVDKPGSAENKLWTTVWF